MRGGRRVQRCDTGDDKRCIADQFATKTFDQFCQPNTHKGLKGRLMLPLRWSLRLSLRLSLSVAAKCSRHMQSGRCMQMQSALLIDSRLVCCPANKLLAAI